MLLNIVMVRNINVSVRFIVVNVFNDKQKEKWDKNLTQTQISRKKMNDASI